jgi:hypothetical protein
VNLISDLRLPTSVVDDFNAFNDLNDFHDVYDLLLTVYQLLSN